MHRSRLEGSAAVSDDRRAQRQRTLPLSHGDSRAAWEQAHEALKADAQLWRRLRLDGVLPDGRGAFYEARTCPQCESTIVNPIVREQAIELCCQLAKLQAQALEALSLAPASPALQPTVLTQPPAAPLPPLGPSSP